MPDYWCKLLRRKATMTTNTQLTIRAQAQGGMFLGPDSFNGAIITVRDGSTILSGPGFTNQGDSGTRALQRSVYSSPYPIVTPGNPITTHWVVANPTKTVMYTANLNLSSQRVLTVDVRVPLPPAQGDQVVTQSVRVDPGPQPPGPGVVIEIPGLWVQPELVVSGTTVSLKTKVTMMCGCEINVGTPTNPSPWIPTDFEVLAQIVKPTPQPPVKLTFDFNSQFLGEMQLPQGSYTAEFSAKQFSVLANTGKATVQFQV
jgi:hypothetical protein